jgi:hypothetical protein
MLHPGLTAADTARKHLLDLDKNPLDFPGLRARL